MPLRSRSARSGPRTSLRAKRCWMPALATTAMRAPASACATDARPPKASACRRSREGRLVGTVRLWHVSAGGIPALMLGPLAVEASSRQLGVGAALMDRALAAAKARGHRAVILLGDAPYYARFGFSADKTGAAVAAGRVRARPAARPRALRRRARWRLGHDRRDRRAAQTEAGRAGKACSCRAWREAMQDSGRASRRVAGVREGLRGRAKSP